MKRHVAVLGIGVAFVVLASALFAAERLVPSEYPTIQAAINDCNDGDVVIVEPNTYTGAGNRDIDFNGLAITVRSIDPNDPCVVAATIIDCNGSEADQHRGFWFHSDEGPNSVLAGFTITNGDYGGGGGIICDHSSPTVRKCVITGNTALMGAGIECQFSEAVITNSVISRNFAVIEGGGIACYSSLSDGSRVDNCVITGNEADMGAGLFNQGGSLFIINCTVSGNKAFAGGAVYCWSETIIKNSILWGDTAARGSEIVSMGGDPKTGYNMVASYSVVEGGLSGVYGEVESWGPGIIDADPCFYDAGYWDANGTPGDANDDFWVGGDYHLWWNSPCIDMGDPNYVAQPNETDLDGNPRVLGEAVDMGAYEFASPVIELSASEFYFEGQPLEECPKPDDQILTIRNGGVGTLNWSATEDCDWLQVEPNSGSSSGEINEVTLHVDVNDLEPTTYYCDITISDPCADNSPQTVQVGLHVFLGCFPCGHPDYGEWVAVGSPDCWCYPRQCHGDADGADQGDPKSGYFYVWSEDLNYLVAGWKQAYGGNPTVDTWICADFDHSQQGDPKSGYFRVWSSDLGILVANWKSNPDPVCLDVP